jgi:hypothetical protein
LERLVEKKRVLRCVKFLFMDWTWTGLVVFLLYYQRCHMKFDRKSNLNINDK